MKRLAIISALISFVSIIGCGGGGGGADVPGTTDISGVWTAQEVSPAPPAPKFAVVGFDPDPPAYWFFAFSNGNITCGTDTCFLNGNVSGTTLTLTGTGGGLTFTLTATIADASSIGGTLTITDGTNTVTKQLTFAKAGTAAGTLTCTGTCSGGNVGLSSTTAFAIRTTADNTIRHIYHLSHNRMFRLTIDRSAALAAGSYAAGQDIIMLSNDGTGGNLGGTSNGGTLTITSVSDERLVGTYDVTGLVLPATGAFNGTFDVPTLIVNN